MSCKNPASILQDLIWSARLLQEMIVSARLLQEMIVSARNLQEMLILQKSWNILSRFVFPVDQGEK